MINADELKICKERGHEIAFTISEEGWRHCLACGAWVRQVRTLEEREDAPSKRERSRAQKEISQDGVNSVEREICKRRGHKLTLLDEDWQQCSACKMWVRDVCAIEEREDEPPLNERSIFSKLLDVERKAQGAK